MLVLCLWPSGLAWAGGAWVPRPLTAQEKQVQQIKEGWRRRGLAAASDLVEAVCKDDDLLAPPAREVLKELGPSALPSLARASSKQRCDLGGIIVGIVCESGAGESDLLAMLRDQHPRTVGTGLHVLTSIGSERELARCGRAAPLVKRITPELRPLLRGQTGQDLHEVLWAVAAGGPDAAPLVAELLPLLDRDEVTGNGAAAALGAIGAAAWSAVPALRAHLRRGGGGVHVTIGALGGIGPSARPALPEFAPLLKRALPQLCSTKPRYSDADALAQAIARATAAIGGTEAEPLIPDMVTAFQKLRACGLLGGAQDNWLGWFGALGSHGRAAEPVLLAIVEDPDESVRLRHLALDSLDATGSSLGSWWSLRAIRRAIDRKHDLFERRGGMPPMQIPPPPPRTPPEFALCREEAGLPPLPEPAELATEPTREGGAPGWAFAGCVRQRLCGPDENTYRKTMALCCAPYAANPPWFCRPTVSPRAAVRRR